MTILAGDGQTGVVGAQLSTPLLIRITDASGNAVPSQVVNFRVISGGGSVFAGASETNADGRAQELWTLGTRAQDTQRVEVRAVDPNSGAPIIFGSFWAVGVPGPPTKLQKASADSMNASVVTGVTPLPRVRLLDQYDNPVSGATVTFTAQAGEGSVTGATQVTDANGYATVGGWTMGSSAGSNTLRASVNGTALSVDFTAHAISPARYVVTSSAEHVEAGASITFNAQLASAQGTAVPLSGQTVTWTGTGDGTFSSATSTTNSAGVATVTFTADTMLDATSATITAADGSRIGAKQVSLVAGPAAKLAFITQPVNTGYLIAIPNVRVAIQDRYGNTRTSDTREITISIGANPGGATLGGDAANAAASGVAAFTDLTLNRAESGYTLVASATGLPSTTSNSFNISPVGVIRRHVLPFAALLLKDGYVWHSISAGIGQLARIRTNATDLRNVVSFGGNFDSAHHLFTDGNYIYATVVSGGTSIRTFSIWRANPDGSGGELIHSSSLDDYPRNYGGAVADSQFIFYSGPAYIPTPTSHIEDRILRVSLPAGDTMRLMPIARPLLAAANGEVFFLDSTTIKAVPRSGGAERVVAAGRIFGMVVLNGTIYVSNGTAIQSVPLSGGTLVTRASGFTSVGRITTDGAALYFADASTLRRVDLSTFAVTTIAQNDNFGSIVVDSESVYWTSTEGPENYTIKKTRK